MLFILKIDPPKVLCSGFMIGRDRLYVHLLISGLNNAWYLVRKLFLIAKKEVLYTGPLGIVTYLCGSLFIDRKKPNEANRILESTAQLMTRDKVDILLLYSI